MTDYTHGGDINFFAKNANCNIDEIIDLSSNINFIKPEINFRFDTVDIRSYPSYDDLYKSLSNYFQINGGCIEVFNGGSSAIFSLMDILDNGNCYIYSPAYLEYKKAALLKGKNVELLNRFTNLYQDIKENSLIVFVNPATPEGTSYDMDELIDFWRKKNCTIIIDESFLEFTFEISAAKYLKTYDKLYILRSMTKFYSCAGVRAGVVLSSEENIKNLKDKTPLWKISQLDSYFIQEILKDKNFKKVAKAVNANAKAYLEGIIHDSDIFEEFIPSHGNFIMARLKKLKASQFQEKLIPYKIMVRDCSNFDFLDESYVRIAVKSIKDLKVFEEALKKIES